MKSIFVNYKQPNSKVDALSICLGYFDGVHLGHQKLIKFAKKNAKYSLGLLTFDKPISSFVNNGKKKEVLTSLNDRFELISKLNVDYLFVLQIDEKFITLTDLDFIKMLQKMNVKEVYVGADFRYGKNASGTIETLQKYFDVRVVDIENVNGEKIASQNIGKLIENGEISYANDLLGHNYKITGEIENGKRIGRTIGFPTLNLKTDTHYLLPKFGVYKTICYLNKIPFESITNVGIKPTVGSSKVTIEIHVLNYSGEIKDKVVSVEFLKFIREEKKFDSLEDLKKQIRKDIESL